MTMSDEFLLAGDANSIGLYGDHSIGIVDPSKFATNQTRYAVFQTERLLSWAEALDEIYTGAVKVQFTPNSPMAAGYWHADEPDMNPSLSVSVAPTFTPEEYEERFGGNDD